MQVLIVKLSSMGDLVQALPALTDARNAIPDIEFDWVVDQAFADIPQWHPAVRNTIHTAHRHWRQNIAKSCTSGELSSFYKQLRATKYDRLIDAQGNAKSATVTALARGLKCGYDKQSVREYGAHWAYHQHAAVPRQQLAIDRLRQLFAQSLGYSLPESPADFGLTGKQWPEPSVALPDQPFLMFVHNASWTNKCWPEHHWRQLIEIAGANGYRILLPWGSQDEHDRAQRLAQGFRHAQVLPRLPLTELAAIFTRCSGAVCVDTGLAHVAAALEVPTVTLYGPTDPNLIGAHGPRSLQLPAQGFACTPCYKRYCDIEGYKGPEAQCLKSFAAEQVWQQFAALQSQTIQLVE